MTNPIKLQQQQDKLKKLISGIVVTGQSKNGKVKVKVSGEQKILDIQIDPALIAFVYENFIKLGKDDALLGKAVMEAVEEAYAQVQAAIVTKLQETGGINDLMDMISSAGTV
jgi:DNA-binding protein YbaB